MGVRLGDGGTEKKGKRAHGCGPQYGDCWGEVGIRGVNSNEENTVKMK